MPDRIRVVYVDDEPDLLELVKISLEAEGEFSVDTFRSAQEALDSPALLQYDALVSDYQMPEMDGIAFLKEVRMRSADMPFILFTGRSREDVVIAAINNGADFYLQKGGNPEAQFAELVHKIRLAVRWKSAKSELAENRDYLHRIFSSVREGIIIIDAKSHEIIDLNPAAENLLGRPRDQILGRVCHQFMCPAEVGRCPITDLHQLVDSSERILLGADGRQIPIIKYVVPLSFQGRECLLETIFDNSERKKAADELRSALEKVTAAEEELRQNYEALGAKDSALRESEEKYRELADLLPQGIYESDTTGRLTYFNRMAAEMSGYGHADFEKGLNVLEVIAPEDRLRATERFRHMAGTGASISGSEEYRLLKKDGSSIPVSIYSSPILRNGRISGIRGLVMDISDRKRAEAALRESEEKFRSIFANSPYPIIITDLPDYRFREVNNAFLQVSGYTDVELLGKSSIEMGFIPAAEAQEFTMARELSGRIENVPLAVTVKDGKKIHVQFSSFPITIRGDPAVVTVIAEVTKLKRVEEELLKKNQDLLAAYEELTTTEEELRQNYSQLHEREEALQRSEEKYRLLTEVTEDIIYMIDIEGKITHVSPQITRYGYDPSAVISHDISEFILEEDLPAVTADMHRTISKNKPTLTRLRILDSTGKVRWMEDNGAPVCDSSGLVTGISGILRDVTDRVEREEALRESEEKFRALVETSPDVIWEIDLRGKVRYMSPMVKNLMGYSPEDLVGKSLMEIVTEDARPHLVREMESIMSSHGPIPPMQYSAYHKDGHVFIVEIRASRLTGPDGKLAGFRGVAIDITERRKAEDALRASEEKFRALVENSLDGIIITDFTGTLLFANAAAGRMVEAPDTASLIGTTNVLKFVAPESRPAVLRDVANVSQGKDAYLVHYLLVTENKREIWAECIGRKIPFGDTSAMLVSMRDVSERVHAEEALRQSEEKFRALVEHSLDGILILNPEGRILFANRTAEKIIDAENLEVAVGSHNVMEFIDPASRGDAERDLSKVAGGADGYMARYLIVTTRKEKRWVESIGKSIVFANAPALLISLRDITDRQQAEAALKDSEELFRQVFANANDAIALVENVSDGPGRFLLVNDRFVNLLGYSREELLQMSPRNIVPVEVMEKIRPDLNAAISRAGQSIFESVYQRRDGSRVSVEVSLHRFMYHGKDVALSHIRDITDRKRDLEALRQANKKLNILSGITRHDIKNKLMTLDGYLALLKKDISDPFHEQLFGKISSASKNIANMIQFTKEYEQIGVQAPVWQDVRTLADAAARDATLGAVQFENEIPAGIEIYADPLIIKVFFNLLDNAVRHGGKITTVRFLLEEQGPERIIVCADDGDGIAPETKGKIFTLGFGKHTGFGLALSREILDITGIAIYETGESGKGARFEIRVPEGGWRIAEKP